MKTIKIKLTYKDLIIISNQQTITDEEYEKIKEKFTKIIKMQDKYLVIENQEGTHFFGNDILKKSIVTLMVF